MELLVSFFSIHSFIHSLFHSLIRSSFFVHSFLVYSLVLSFNLHSLLSVMGARSALVALALLGSSAVIAIPTPSSSYEYGDGCTFTGSTGAASAIASKSSCSTITLNNVAVPAGQTLDLSNLGQGTTVSRRF